MSVVEFRSPDIHLKALTSETTGALIAESNDLCLIIDKKGVVQDVAVSGDDESLNLAGRLIGKRWIDTVGVDSRKKIEQLLDPEARSKKPRWREINQHLDDGRELPMLFKAVPFGEAHTAAVGRDLRPVAKLQQRLLDVQSSLERDYARLHQTETRYRMLFNMATEAILIVDADSRKIVEANPAAGRLLDRPAGKLVNRTFPRGFSDNSIDAIEDVLLRVRAAGGAEDVIVLSADSRKKFRLTASLIRQEEGPYFLIRMVEPGDSQASGENFKILDVMRRSPDAFVVTDPDGNILTANDAFLDLCQVATELQVKNQPLGEWLGRPGIDANLLLRTLRERGQVRQYATAINPEFGTPINVELSAVSALDSDEPCFGFVIRSQMLSIPREKSGEESPLPKTLEEITDLVGRVPLKDLVRETTDIIERLCIEAALKITNDSRASAAEILGLSRQSLYVKLRRYGLGDSTGSENDS